VSIEPEKKTITAYPARPGDVPHTASLRPLLGTLPVHQSGLTLGGCPVSIDSALTTTAA
jgi:hypothetical protein